MLVKCKMCKFPYVITEGNYALKSLRKHGGFLPCQKCGSHATEWSVDELLALIKKDTGKDFAFKNGKLVLVKESKKKTAKEKEAREPRKGKWGVKRNAGGAYLTLDGAEVAHFGDCFNTSLSKTGLSGNGMTRAKQVLKIITGA